MMKTILLLVVAVLALASAAVLIIATTRPDSFRLERSASIAAPPDKVFAMVHDLHQFNTWNPWLRKEPDAEQRYEGAATGVGSAYLWRGKQTGSGRMEIVDALPSQRVTMRLDFYTPFKAQNQAEFTIAPQAGGLSTIRWAMTGPSPFVSKLMSVFISMDKMVGPDFEAGLANLKSILEKR
jgi:uncharacterized protein YndB with AHSA1/START domain